MKAVDWMRYLQEQRETHGKVVFTVSELANVAAQEWPSLKVALQRHVEQGIMERYADGRYGLPGAVSAEDLIPSLDPAAYITGFHALHRYSLVTQAPRVVHAFTSRRHNRSRERVTSVGRIVFVCVSSSVYSFPAEGIVALPEQALFDYVYVLRRRSLHAASLVTFRNLDRLQRSVMSELAPRYPGTVRKQVREILGTSFFQPDA
jgi:hypothetical protein